MVPRIRLANLLAGLSLAADVGFGVPPDEAVRACVIGTNLARRLDLSESEVAAVFYTALLHHVGCTAFAHETALIFGDEFAMNTAAAKTNFDDPRDMFRTFLPEVTRGARPADRARIVAFALTRGNRFGRRFTTATCEVARETARRLRLSEEVQQSLYHFYEAFNGKGVPAGLEGDAIPLPARVARVASAAALFDTFGGRELAVDALERRAGGFLDPTIVAAFASDAEILGELSASDPRKALLEMNPSRWRRFPSPIWLRWPPRSPILPI